MGITYRELLCGVVNSVEDLDSPAIVHIVRRGSGNVAVEVADVPIVRVGLYGKLCIEEKQVAFKPI